MNKTNLITERIIKALLLWSKGIRINNLKFQLNNRVYKYF